MGETGISMKNIRMRETSFRSSGEDRNAAVFDVFISGVSYCDGTYYIKRNKSDVCVFEYIRQGQGTIIINGQQFFPKQGDVYILHKGSDHEYFSDKKNPWIKYWFNVKGELVEQLVSVYGLQHVYHIENCPLRKTFEKGLAIAGRKDMARQEINGKLSLVIHEIIMKAAAHCRSAEPEHSEPVLRMKLLLEDRVEGKVTIKDIAAAAGRSTSQAIRIFKKEIGFTPYDFFLQKKVEAAKIYLLHTGMSIKEIALKLQFADEYYFSNFFKQKTGIAPSQYKIAGDRPL